MGCKYHEEMVKLMNTQIIHLAIPGEPQGKQRHKWSPRGTYSPKKTVNYETYIKELFAVKYPDFRPVESVLIMELQAWLMIPTSASKKKRKLMQDLALKPGKRPDIDNVIKVVMDALEKLAYKNDSQIVEAHLYKFYAERPRLDIRISEFE